MTSLVTIRADQEGPGVADIIAVIDLEAAVGAVAAARCSLIAIVSLNPGTVLL